MIIIIIIIIIIGKNIVAMCDNQTNASMTEHCRFAG